MSLYNFFVFKIMTFGYYFSLLLLLINGFYDKESGKFHLPHTHFGNSTKPQLTLLHVNNYSYVVFIYTQMWRIEQCLSM